MQEPRRLIVIAKQREFNEEKWKQLLMAIAYYLHEQRQTQATRGTDNKADPPTKP
jgi:hypothetical protein